MRIMNVPYSAEAYKLHVLDGCDDLMTYLDIKNNQEYCRWQTNHYTPLQNLSWNPSVTVNNVQECIQHHILPERTKG